MARQEGGLTSGRQSSDQTRLKDIDYSFILGTNTTTRAVSIQDNFYSLTNQM